MSPCSSPYGDSVSKEIRHKVASQYSNQVRDELLTNKLPPANESVSTEKNEEFNNPASTLRQRKTELLGTTKTNITQTQVQDFDGVISNEQQTQEEITNNLLLMAKTMKEQTMSANSIIRQDLITLEKSNILAEENQTNLQTVIKILIKREVQERPGRPYREAMNGKILTGKSLQRKIKQNLKQSLKYSKGKARKARKI